MRIRILALTLLIAIATQYAVRPALATRHHSYTGTITAIAATTLTIHSKAHNTNFRFIINGQTRFLQKGKDISRGRFHTGSYVYVSYSSGPRNSMIAWHISLRR